MVQFLQILTIHLYNERDPIGERVNMDNLENKADEFAKKMEEASNDGWNVVKSGAEKMEEAAAEVKSTAAEAATDSWNKVEETAEKASGIDAWKKIDEEARKVESQMNDAANQAEELVEEASGDVYTPAAGHETAWEAEAPTQPETPIKPEETWTAPVFKPVQPEAASSAGTPPPTPGTTQKKFPIWAIILIVLFVLCICGALGVWLVASVFSNAFEGVGILLSSIM